MTKQEAIENHRKLWNWIADTSEKENRCVGKYGYFKENNISNILNNCYCCEYADANCEYCPIKWYSSGYIKNAPCLTRNAEYDRWCDARKNNDIDKCIELARIIANLPENQDVE